MHKQVFGQRIDSEGIGKSAWFIRTSLSAALLIIMFLAQGISASDQSVGQKDSAVRATLNNGLRVVIVQNSLAPVVTTVMSYLVGSTESPEGFPGTAHAQEYMLFRGSPGLSAGQLSNITAAMGGMFNATTQQNVTNYWS